MSGAGQVFDIQRFSIHDGPGIRTIVFLKGCPMGCWWCSNPESQRPDPEMMWYASRCLHCGLCVETCPQGAMAWGGGAGKAPGNPGRLPEVTIDHDMAGPVLERVRCNACGGCAKRCPSGALRLVGETRSVEDVLRLVARDQPFYRATSGGMTISGGEPMLQPAFILSLLEAAHRSGISTVLETAGFCAGDELLQVARLCEVVMFDLKHCDPGVHRRLTGVGNEKILENLRLLVGSGVAVRVRIPLINGLTATRENIRGISVILRDLWPAGRRARGAVRPHVELMPYHALGSGKYAALGRAYPMTQGAETPCGGNTEPMDAVSPGLIEELKTVVIDTTGLACLAAGSPPV